MCVCVCVCVVRDVYEQSVVREVCVCVVMCVCREGGVCSVGEECM